MHVSIMCSNLRRDMCSIHRTESAAKTQSEVWEYGKRNIRERFLEGGISAEKYEHEAVWPLRAE